MSSLVRWDPFTTLEPLSNAMDRLFPDSLLFPWRRDSLGVGAAMDMYETDDAVVITVSVPGAKPEDVEVSVVGDTLTIRGEIKVDDNIDKGQYLYRELARGRFSRTVTLPGLVQADKARASYEHGVLTVTVPKAEEARPKVIKVKAR